MLVINLTVNERNTLIQLLDLAVKAGGLNVAEASLIILKKLSDAKETEDK